MEALPSEILGPIMEEALNGTPVRRVIELGSVCSLWRALIPTLPLRVQGRVAISFLDRFPLVRVFTGIIDFPKICSLEMVTSCTERVLRWIRDLRPSVVNVSVPGVVLVTPRYLEEFVLPLTKVPSFSIRSYDDDSPFFSSISFFIEYKDGTLELEDHPLEESPLVRMIPHLEHLTVRRFVIRNSDVDSDVMRAVNPKILEIRDVEYLPWCEDVEVEELRVFDDAGNIANFSECVSEFLGSQILPQITSLTLAFPLDRIPDARETFPNVRRFLLEPDIPDEYTKEDHLKIWNLRREGIHLEMKRPSFDTLSGDIIRRIGRHLSLRDLRSFAQASRRYNAIEELSGEGPGNRIPLAYLVMFKSVSSFNGYFEIRKREDLTPYLFHLFERISWHSWYPLRQVFFRVVMKDDVINDLLSILIRGSDRLRLSPTTIFLISFPEEPRAGIWYNQERGAYDLVLPSRFAGWGPQWTSWRPHTIGEPPRLITKDQMNASFFY